MTTSDLPQWSNRLRAMSGAVKSVRSFIAIPEDDASLVQRVVSRDSQAFETLYARHAPSLRRYLNRRLQRQELVDEVLNDSMMVLWQHATRFNTATAPLAAWLCGIARQKARKAWARTVLTSTRSPSNPEESDLNSPEAMVLHQEQGHALTRALRSLPSTERTTVELVVFEGWSCQEVAVQTGVPVSTVTTQLWRARRRLSTCVAANEKPFSQQATAPLSPGHKV